MDRNGDVVAANEALDLITEGADPELVGPGTNAYRLALHPRGMAPRILNFAEWARHILERTRHLTNCTPNSRSTSPSSSRPPTTSASQSRSGCERRAGNCAS